MNLEIDRLRKGVKFAKDHLDDAEYNEALIVLHAVVDRIVTMIERKAGYSTVEGVIMQTKDKPNGKDKQSSKGS